MEQPKHPGGRPTTYTPEILEATRDFFSDYEPWYESPVDRQLKDGSIETRMERLPNPPPSILALHRHLRERGIDVARASLYDWQERDPEFSAVIKSGITSLYPEVLQENAMLGKYAPAFAIFAAKNRMGWTDRQENTVRFPEPTVIKDPTGKVIESLGGNQ
jgi:hypothetical protein